MNSDSEEDCDYNPGPSMSKCDTAGGACTIESGAQKDQDPLTKLKSDARKARINSIWEQLNAKDSAITSRVGGKNISLKGDQAKIPKSSPPEWMVSLGLASKKSSSTTIKGTNDEIRKEDAIDKEDARKIAAAALAAAREASIASKEGKIEVNEVRDFAGEEVKITKFVDPNSKAAEALKRKQEMMALSSSGLDKLLQQIDKKPKLNILDKSRKDWGDFKEEKQLEDELESYKKSGDKYLDKLAFLQRSDLREYEKERAARQVLRAKRQNDVSFAE